MSLPTASLTRNPVPTLELVRSGPDAALVLLAIPVLAMILAVAPLWTPARMEPTAEFTLISTQDIYTWEYLPAWDDVAAWEVMGDPTWDDLA